MKEKFAKLIDVKSIVTFVVIGVFAYLAVAGKVEAKDFMVIVTAIITYFFARKGGSDENK